MSPPSEIVGFPVAAGEAPFLAASALESSLVATTSSLAMGFPVEDRGGYERKRDDGNAPLDMPEGVGTVPPGTEVQRELLILVVPAARAGPPI